MPPSHDYQDYLGVEEMIGYYLKSDSVGMHWLPIWDFPSLDPNAWSSMGIIP
jgi:hypothetical protein